jgi:hypothetical protein
MDRPLSNSPQNECVPEPPIGEREKEKFRLGTKSSHCWRGEKAFAGQIHKVNYSEWLANVVLVKKSNGKWRMCIDFIDLNKACLKDSFSLPQMDLLVDSTSEHELINFMDAFLGYNMNKADLEETSFITDQGL